MMSDAVKNRSMKAQYDASSASEVFGNAKIKTDAESLLSSSLTHSPSPLKKAKQAA
jgi:hypothetical protein